MLWQNWVHTVMLYDLYVWWTAECTVNTFNIQCESAHHCMTHFDTSLTRDTKFVCQCKCNRDATFEWMLSSLMPLSNHFLLMINKLHPTGPNSVETHDALQLHNVKLLLWYYWYMMVHDGTWWYMMVHVMSYMHNIFDQIWSNMTAHPAGTWAWGNPNQRANENSHILGSCIKNASKRGSVVWLCHNFYDITSWKFKVCKTKI